MFWKVITELCFGIVLGAIRYKTKNCYSTMLLHGIMNLFGIVITYFIIKLAVKYAINESLENIKSTVKEAIIVGLSEYEYKNQNK